MVGKRKDQGKDPYVESFRKNRQSPFRTLIGFYRGHYGKFCLSALFFSLKHCCVWVLPIVTANIINIAVKSDSDGLQKIVFNITLILILILINVPMNYLYIRFRSKATRAVEAGLRGAMVRKLLQLSIGYHTGMQSGRLQSKVMRDVEAVETISQQLFVNVMYLALNLVIALAVTGMKNRIVLLFFLIAAPIAVSMIVIFRSGIRRTNAMFRKEMEETSAKVMEMEELIPVTRAHALEEEELKKMSRQLKRVAEQGYRMDIVQANFGAASWAVFNVFQVLCLGFTGILAFKGQIQVGDVALYQTYFTTIVNQLSTFLNLIPVITKGLESVNSIGEVLLAEDTEDSGGKLAVDQVKGGFEFRDIFFSYDGKNPVLNQFSLKVAAGETIALVGESGAGKSTIVNLVIGFLKPGSGEILLDGFGLTEIDLTSYRRHLAVVPQTSLLFSGTIRENITYGMEKVSEACLYGAVEAANLLELIEELPEGLDTPVGEHGGKLSGGQRQRIAIARALIRDPQVIVLDEATSALDTMSEREIQKALANLRKGRTTFVVAHRLSTIRNADKIAVISDGRCAEYGTFEELMKAKGEFYEMWQLQAV